MPVVPPVLDAAQRAVVEHAKGPLLVLAGPGTGKTTTLVEAALARVRAGTPPERVLVLTFHRRAAADLRDRMAARAAGLRGSPQAGTFHSFAYALLRAHQEPDLFAEPIRLLSGPEQDLMVRDLLAGQRTGPVRWPDDLRAALTTRGFADEVRAVLARTRELGLPPEALAGFAHRAGRPEWLAAAAFLGEYLDVADLQGVIDYTELVHRAVRLAPQAAGRYDVVLVDEFQDTDPAQVRLLRALAGQGRTLIAFGDPDQSVHAFRGADVNGILDFPDVFRHRDGRPAEVRVLGTARRGGPALLAATRQFATRIPLRRHPAHRSLTPAPAGGPAGTVAVHTFPTPGAELASIADTLRRAHLEDGVPWRDMAVLVRAAAALPALRRALTTAGVPTDTPAPDLPLHAEPAVATLLLALRVAAESAAPTADTGSGAAPDRAPDPAAKGSAGSEALPTVPRADVGSGGSSRRLPVDAEEVAPHGAEPDASATDAADRGAADRAPRTASTGSAPAARSRSASAPKPPEAAAPAEAADLEADSTVHALSGAPARASSLRLPGAAEPADPAGGAGVEGGAGPEGGLAVSVHGTAGAGVATASAHGRAVDGAAAESVSSGAARSGPSRALTGAAGAAGAVEGAGLAGGPTASAQVMAVEGGPTASGPLRTAVSVEDALTLLASPLGGMDAADLRRLGRALREEERAAGRSVPRPSDVLIAEALAEPARLVVHDPAYARGAQRLAALLARARDTLVAGGTAEEALWALWDGSAWSARLERAALRGGAAGRNADRDLDAVCALFETAARAEERTGGRGALNLIEELSRHDIAADTLSGRTVRPDAVQLMTAHRSKGLEWRLVVVAGVQEGVWPDLRRRGSLLEADRIGRDGLAPPLSQTALLAEERRLFYVAATRAGERLLVTAVRSAADDGDRPSRFLAELGVEPQDVPHRPRRPLAVSALVAELRATTVDPAASPALREAAARRLARLAALTDEGHPLVPAAHPDRWWGLYEPTRSAAPVRDRDAPVALSGSALDQLANTCALQWFLGREVNAQPPSTAAQGFGNVVHVLADEVASGRAPADLDVLMARLDSVWDALAFDAPWKSRQEKDNARAALERFLRWHVMERGRTPVATEHGFDVTFDVTLAAGEVQVRIRGSMDRVESDAEGRAYVVDFKTGRAKPTAAEVARHPQLAVYQLAVREGAVDPLFGGQRPAAGGAELVQLRLGAPRRDGGEAVPAVQRQEPLAGEWAQQLLAEAAGRVLDERFTPASGQHCAHCSFHSACTARPEGRHVVE